MAVRKEIGEELGYLSCGWSSFIDKLKPEVVFSTIEFPFIVPVIIVILPDIFTVSPDRI
jgi:hypothetical protein